LYVFNEGRLYLITCLYQLKLLYAKINVRKTFCASCGRTLEMVIIKGEVFQAREKGEILYFAELTDIRI